MITDLATGNTHRIALGLMYVCAKRTFLPHFASRVRLVMASTLKPLVTGTKVNDEDDCYTPQVTEEAENGSDV